MGTPGDKEGIGKVVGTGDHHPWPPEQTQSPQIQQLLPTTSAATSSSIILASPSTSSSSTSVNPQFDSLLPQICSRSDMGYQTATVFQPINPLPSSSSSTSPTVIKSEDFPSLEQATIEDYFTQSKYYATSTAEGIDYNPDQPGPSGLQSRKPSGKKSKLDKPGKKYQCPICQKNFTTFDKLTKHQQIHTNQSPFKCEHCKKVFTSKFKLVRHALIHSDRKPFSCTVCERTFHRKDHLKNHIKVHSPSKKVYTCDKADCKKEYTSLLSYRKHLAIHAAEEGNLKCQICSVTFQNKQEILYHLKVHAGSRTVKNPNEKKFVCDTCGRRFFTKKDVRRHLVVHTGLREFLCQFCPQRFGRKDHLVRHIKKSHNKNYQSETADNIKQEPLPLDLPSTATIPAAIEDIAVVKTEYLEGTPEDLELTIPPNLFVDHSLFLPSSSELRDLGGGILEEIEPMPSTSAESAEILDNPELEQLFQGTTSEEKNVKLPAFSKTFQPPPPS